MLSSFGGSQDVRMLVYSRSNIDHVGEKTGLLCFNSHLRRQEDLKSEILFFPKTRLEVRPAEIMAHVMGSLDRRLRKMPRKGRGRCKQ